MAPRKKKAGTELAVLTPEQTAELAAEREQYAQALQAVQSAVIDSQEKLDAWVIQIQALKTRKKMLTEQRDVLLAPAKATVEAIKDQFNPLLDFLEALAKAAQGKVDGVLAQQRAAQLAALNAVEEAGGKTDAATLAVAVGAENVALPAGTFERTYWHAEVSDFGLLIDTYYTAFCASRAGFEPTPQQLMVFAAFTIDTSALNAMAREHKEALNIPGVRAVSTTKMGTRS
jgi:hypothetical protein